MFAEVICALAQQVPFATRVCPCGQLNCGGGCGGGGSEVGGGAGGVGRCGEVGEAVGVHCVPVTVQLGGQQVWPSVVIRPGGQQMPWISTVGG